MKYFRFQLFFKNPSFRGLLARCLQVCPVEAEWLDALLERLRNVNVKRLSGGATTAAELAAAEGEAHQSVP